MKEPTLAQLRDKLASICSEMRALEIERRRALERIENHPDYKPEGGVWPKMKHDYPLGGL